MATLNELIAQLNASTGNILSDASRLNTTADNMNQTLDGMGVQEVSGIAELAPGRTVGEQRDAGMYDSGQLQYTDVAPSDYGFVGANAQLPEQGIISQIKNTVMDYVKSGGILGIGANILGGFLPKESSTNQFLLDTYGGYGPYGRQDKFGYNVVSMADNYMTPGSNSFRSHALEGLASLDQALANDFYQENYGLTFDQVKQDIQNKQNPFGPQPTNIGTSDYYGGNDPSGGFNDSRGKGGGSFGDATNDAGFSDYS